MRAAGGALTALAEGSVLLRRRAQSACQNRVGSFFFSQRSPDPGRPAKRGFSSVPRRTRQTAPAVHTAQRTQPLMTAAPSYDYSRSSVSDERQIKVKQKAALQALREAVAHHGDTSLSQQGETDVELMYDGVHYLEHVISSRREFELQQVPGASTDLDVLHGILKAWCHERRNAGPSPITALEPRIMLEWIDQLASSAANAQPSGGLMMAPSRETYRYLMDADPTNVALVETLFERMQRSEDPGLSPAVDDFHRVMHANLHNRRLQTAEVYLQALLQLHRSSQQDSSSAGLYQPSPRTYNLIIAGYAKAERPQDANRILQQMLDDGFVTNTPADPPPAYCFETCLNAWVAIERPAARRGDSEAAAVHGRGGQRLGGAHSESKQGRLGSVPGRGASICAHSES
jgi:pentatricopeptide repeat protein